jgi:hypothetical protein
MDPDLSSAEKTALNVFHDLHLAHAREERGAPKRAARVRVSSEGNFVTEKNGSQPGCEPNAEAATAGQLASER